MDVPTIGGIYVYSLTLRFYQQGVGFKQQELKFSQVVDRFVSRCLTISGKIMRNPNILRDFDFSHVSFFGISPAINALWTHAVNQIFGTFELPKFISVFMFHSQLCALHELHIFFDFFNWSLWSSPDPPYCLAVAMAAMAAMVLLAFLETAALEVARSRCHGVPWPTGPTGCEEMGPAKERAMKFLEDNMPPWDVINKGTLQRVRIQSRYVELLLCFFFFHISPFDPICLSCNIDITPWRLEALGRLQSQLLLLVDCSEICHHFSSFGVSNMK